MTEKTLQDIASEMANARNAARQGRHGLSRVCARRAVGLALAEYRAHHPDLAWGNDAVARIAALKEIPDVPDAVRAAASRLSARVTADFSYTDGADPIADAGTILAFLVPSPGDAHVR